MVHIRKCVCVCWETDGLLMLRAAREFVSEGAAPGSGSEGEEKTGGRHSKRDVSIMIWHHRCTVRTPKTICSRLLLLSPPLSPLCLYNFVCKSPLPSSQIWRGEPCRLKSEGSHFGRRLLLWKSKKLPREEKKKAGWGGGLWGAEPDRERERDHSVPFQLCRVPTSLFLTCQMWTVTLFGTLGLLFMLFQIPPHSYLPLPSPGVSPYHLLPGWDPSIFGYRHPRVSPPRNTSEAL